MITAPVELVLVRFPENRFRGSILAALDKLVKGHVIRIIDLILVMKDARGNVSILDMDELEDEDFKAFNPLIAKKNALLKEEDAMELAKEMENNSSAGIMLFEDTWAEELAESIDEAGGEVIVNERVPLTVIKEVQASR